MIQTSHCIIKDIQNDKTIFMGHRCDNVYTINISKYDGHDRCFSSMHDQSWLWHRRLGYTNMDLISQLNKNEFVRGRLKINFQKDKSLWSLSSGKTNKKTLLKTKTSFPLLLHLSCCIWIYLNLWDTKSWRKILCLCYCGWLL